MNYKGIELKLNNNPCKFCNGEIDEGKPLCGDLVDKEAAASSHPLGCG